MGREYTWSVTARQHLFHTQILFFTAHHKSFSIGLLHEQK